MSQVWPSGEKVIGLEPVEAEAYEASELPARARIPGDVLVIMPAFNAAKYIDVSIESVRSQTYSGWRLIIVNDGSTDDTGIIADRFAALDSRIHVVHQANGGISRARNRALQEIGDCDFIAFLDSDDFWEQDALEIRISALDSNPQVIGVHGMLRYVDASGQPLRIQGTDRGPLRRRAIYRWRLATLAPSDDTTFEALAYANCVPTSSVLLRRSVLDKLEFDQTLVQGEDWAVWLNLVLDGSRFAFLERVVYAYRRHGTNTTRDSDGKNSQLYAVRRMFYRRASAHSLERRTLLFGFKYYEVYRAVVALRRAVWAARKSRWRESVAHLQTFAKHVARALVETPLSRETRQAGGRSSGQIAETKLA
jgi:glycosyltransferase involved in cell wall biosynthesis